MRKLKVLKTDIKKCNEEVFGNFEVQYVDMERRIRELDEKEGEGHRSITLTNEKKEVRCAFEDLICKKPR